MRWLFVAAGLVVACSSGGSTQVDAVGSNGAPYAFHVTWSIQSHSGSAATCPDGDAPVVSVYTAGPTSTQLGTSVACDVGGMTAMTSTLGSLAINLVMTHNAPMPYQLGLGSATVDVKADTVTDTAVVITLLR